MQPIQQAFKVNGYVKYGHKVTTRSDRGKRIGDTFESEGVLAYELVSARNQDYQFAGLMDASLDLKIKTRFPPSFRNINKNKLVCMIDKTEYDVIKVDSDKNNRYLYFYLQEVGEIVNE